MEVFVAGAAEDAAAGEAMFIYCAFALNIIGTDAVRHRFDILGANMEGEVVDFRRCDVEPVVERFEVAAVAAGATFTRRAG